MAVVKLSGLISDIRGRLGTGMVFGIWRGKNWVRMPASSIGNPQSDLQRPIREAITELKDSWKNDLSAAQRDGWNSLAAELTSASAQYSAMESTPQNGFPRLAGQDQSVMTGFNLFCEVNVGRAQAATPTGQLVVNAAAQTLPLVREVLDAPAAASMVQPPAPRFNSASWNATSAELEMDIIASPWTNVDVPAADLVDSQQIWTEVYLRTLDPRVNRLNTYTGEFPNANFTPTEAGRWVPGGTSGSTSAFVVGFKGRVVAVARTLYGQVSQYSAYFDFLVTAPP